jgi:hypothetical protein
MAGFPDMQRPPSMLDLATVAHTPGGVTYLYQSEEATAQERETARQLAAFHAEQAAWREKEAAVSARVKAFVAAGPGGEPSATARDRLLIHIAWLARTRQQADMAGTKARETASANARHDAAVTELATIEGEIDRAHAEWAKFTCDLPPPDGRIAERQAQEQTIRETASMAQIADATAFESAVAQAAVKALELMLSLRQREVLREIEGQRLAATVREATSVIDAALGEMAALDEVAQMDWEVSHTLTDLGIKAPAPFLPTRTKVSIPGQPTFEVKATAAAVTRFQATLGRLAEAPDQPPEPPVSGRKSLIGAALAVARMRK